ncbi:glycosyltransferase [Lacticaseibacillus daqingensis]|uniref:glycosyltransferase n=1 Tax=Lacticaseibacillus daqingensis TaxID=2486014 RepID=UPI000F766DD3|nr:glycosyltransferase [Lacticaseibacillus daqingensis]
MRVLYISLVDWFWIKQRPQHICQGLAQRGIDVDYFSPISWRKAAATQHSSEDDTSLMNFTVGEHLRVVRKKLLPLGRLTLMRRLNTVRMRHEVNKLLSKTAYDMIILTHPAQLPYVPTSLLSRVIYDCMDNYETFIKSEIAKRECRANEQILINKGAATIVSSEFLGKTLESRVNHPVKYTVVNNGVEFQRFSANVSDSQDPLVPTVTYVGVISSWFDLDLIQQSASKHPEVKFNLIGPVEVSTTDVTATNVHFLGPVPYTLVPSRLSESSVLVMPFKLNEIVKAVNPVKLYEYLATGRPVIARRYGETEKFAPIVSLYDNESEFESMLSLALAPEARGSEVVEKRVAFASENDWQARANQFKQLITDSKDKLEAYS